MTLYSPNSIVIPGRVEDANPESRSQTNLGIPDPARRAVPE
jgi:hypothetical protein